MADPTPAGTPEPKPNDSGNAGTPAGASDDSAKDGAKDWEAEYHKEHAERLANLAKVEAANRVLAEAETRKPPPTNGPGVQSWLATITPEDVRAYENVAANDTDEGNRRWAKGILASIEGGLTAMEAQRQNQMTRQLMDYTRDERVAIEKEFARGGYRDIKAAAAAIESARVPTLVQQNEALSRRVAELEKKPTEAGTHMPAMPASGGGAPQSIDGDALRELHRTDRAKARQMERDIDAGKVTFIPT